MRGGAKVVAIAVGALIAFLAAGWLIGLIMHAVIDVVIVAAIVGGIVIAVRMAMRNRQVSGGKRPSEVRDSRSRSLASIDADDYVPPRAAQPAPRPAAADVDDELERLKREMGS